MPQAAQSREGERRSAQRGVLARDRVDAQQQGARDDVEESFPVAGDVGGRKDERIVQRGPASRFDVVRAQGRAVEAIGGIEGTVQQCRPAASAGVQGRRGETFPGIVHGEIAVKRGALMRLPVEMAPGVILDDAGKGLRAGAQQLERPLHCTQGGVVGVTIGEHRRQELPMDGELQRAAAVIG